MQIHIYDNAEIIGQAAAALFAAQILKNPACVLGFATGSTPLPTYRQLIKLHQSGVLDFSRVTTFNLDEYAGIERTHAQSYYTFMNDNLFSQVNVNPANVHLPDPGSDAAGCAAYDAAIAAAGGLDLQILGIGHNGHIAFNEPASTFADGTNIVELTASTIEANKRFFADANDVPRRAVSMGIGSIMRAKEIVLIATGEGKAAAVRQMVRGPVDPQCPASALLLHPAVTVLLDKQAAGLL